MTSVKKRTGLAAAIRVDGRIDEAAVGGLVRAVGKAARAAEAERVDELIAFATSAVRDAVNRGPVTARVAAGTGIRLGFLTGRDEARLTFLAARAWYGWSAGSMLLSDIGGGSLEIAAGDGRLPAIALSLPLGAGRLTREYLPGDPPCREDVRRLTRQVAERLEAATRDLRGRPAPVRVVGTSRTFQQLARLTGAPSAGAGPYVRRTLDRERLRARIPLLAAMSAEQRASLRGLSKPRARQILAGAIVADAVMTVFGLERVDICPWALREGIVVRRMQSMPDPAMTEDLRALVQAPPVPVSGVSHP